MCDCSIKRLLLPPLSLPSYLADNMCQFTVGNILDILVFLHIPAITRNVNVSIVLNACRCIKLITIFKYTQ